MCELIKEAEARRMLGGISQATFFRGLASGRYPRGVRVGPNSVRYVKHEIEECIRAMMKERDNEER